MLALPCFLSFVRSCFHFSGRHTGKDVEQPPHPHINAPSHPLACPPQNGGLRPNGFVFDGIDAGSLNTALDRALRYYRERPEWWEGLR